VRRRLAVCDIIPPHILRSIAERGDDDLKLIAYSSLETSSSTRGERRSLALIASALAVAPGEKRRTIYDARHSRKLPGKLVRGEGDAAVRDAAVNEAFDGSGKTYEFFRKVLDRNSIDGAGMRLDSTVHYGVRFSNAQWNGRQMIFGDGDGRLFQRFTGSLDVIAHELTHGVIQHSAAFDDHDQPGALGEHFADVFGVLVKQHSLKQTAARADWLIGTNLFTPKVSGVAIRSMKAPGSAYDDPIIGKDPQPAHMRSYDRSDFDNGGVHVNSGIPNHAFYRVATLLGGKAWEVAGRIWYRALVQHLGSESSFQDCADATYATAGEMYGPASAPAEAVQAGWRAVGIMVSRTVIESGPLLRVHRGDEYRPPAPAAEVPVDWPRSLPRRV
jgi:Zn-dependent metalloprotease